MAKKKVDSEKTLAYAAAFLMDYEGGTIFTMGKNTYKHLSTVFDKHEDGYGNIAIVVVLNVTKGKYEALSTFEADGKREVIITGCF